MNAETQDKRDDNQPAPMPEDPPPSKAAGDADRPRRGPKIRTILSVILLGVLGLSGLGMWWSMQPQKFDVIENARELLEGQLNEDIDDDTIASVPGTVSVATAARVAQTLLEKPGGYLHNDVTPPGALMDNMPSWEYGVLTELRDSVRSFRNDFSRSQTQSVENRALKRADSEFNFDAKSWFLPSAEEEYGQGVMELQDFVVALHTGSDSSARFYARADNLSAYLAVVEKRLGSYGQRLASSVGDPELTAAIGGGAQIIDQTPWHQVDNVFYEARGYSWALLHMMKALAVDFREVLANKNAQVSLQQIIRDLELATIPKWSPVVLNGHGFGVLANHSLVLASYIARANAAVLDLRVLLQTG